MQLHSAFPQKKIVIVNCPSGHRSRRWGDENAVENVANVLKRHGHPTKIVEFTNSFLSSLTSQEIDDTLFFPNGHRIWNDLNSPLLVHEFERSSLKFIGSSTLSFSILTDKARLKQRLDFQGILTPRWLILGAGQFIADEPCNLKFPAVIKPVAGAESEGVLYVATIEDLRKILGEGYCEQFGSAVLEEWHRREEFTIAILGNRPKILIAPVKIIQESGSKVVGARQKAEGLAKMLRLVDDPVRHQQLVSLAEEVFDVLRLRDWTRVDVVGDDRGLYVIDVNALPGLRTDARHPSLFPLCFELCYGLTSEQVITKLISASIERHFGLSLA